MLESCVDLLKNVIQIAICSHTCHHNNANSIQYVKSLNKVFEIEYDSS